MELLPRYFAVLDQITTQAGARPDRIYPYVTPNMRSNLSLVFDKLQRDKHNTHGRTTIVDEVFLGYTENGGEASVGVRVCIVISDASDALPPQHARTPMPTARSESEQGVPYDAWLTTRAGDGDRLYVASTRGRRDLSSC